MKITSRAQRSPLSGRNRIGTGAAGAGAAASAALGLLVLATVFIAVTLPRANLGYRTHVLQQAFRAVSATQASMLAGADITGLVQSDYSTTKISLGVRQVGLDGNSVAARLRRAGLPLARAAQWAGVTATAGPLSGAPRPPPGSMAPPQLELIYRTRLDHDARLVAGSLPARIVGKGDAATFQVAVTTATAARLGLHVGSRLSAAGQALVVTGIIRPVSPGSSFWTVDPSAAVPILTYPNPNAAPFLSTAAFVGPAELPALEAKVNNQHMIALWVFPLDLSRVSADQAAGLLQALQGVTSLPAHAGLQVNLSTGLVTALPPVLASDAAVQGALSPLFVSLAAVGAVMMLMGAQLVAGHRQTEFAMMRARGASLAQVAALAAGGAAAAVLPAAAIGVTAGLLVTPGPT
jgi:putative ABC transport system permease protein